MIRIIRHFCSCRMLLQNILVLSMAGLAVGQQPVSKETDPVRLTWMDHQGVMSCEQCHYEPAAGIREVDRSYSRQDELSFWLAHDKHAIARRRVEPLTKTEVLAEAAALAETLKEMANKGVDVEKTILGWLGTSNALSHRICEKLGYDVKNPGDTRFRDNCLSCHGGYRADVESDKADFANDQPGISCNHCHQLGDDDTWVSSHGLRDKIERWRALTAEEKSTEGMRDLVTTSNQASLCFDCHIGNRSQNQFVTHEMYAAGHPPLPSIELQTFSKQMPQHWRTLSELHDALPENSKEQYFRLHFPGIQDAGGTFWNTRKLLIGALAARIKTLDLITDSQQMQKWADYALYDCAACHHELKADSRRQRRGYVNAPGRPRQPEWPDLQLVHIAAFLAKDEPEIIRLESELSRRFSETPFGDASRVADAANTLRQRLLSALETAESTTVDANVAMGVLRGLVRTPADRLITYDSARQVVWAIRVIAQEMEAEGVPLKAGVQKLIDNLDQPEIAADRLGLTTVLPAGRDRFIYPDGLRADLERRSHFNSELLEERLREINRMLTTSGVAAANR